ncbi:uracil-DNA glycosylase family protein [Rhodalgimonas zhirmunskyi]|uniref:Uracil-DNA glycosylase family protein n=1 Tax=Rhodalgimonas zhirmunskyi TaxID=2964767 RepID=A0AAJ1U8S0_9RHOB|nr:uracil-DNA glycosylase family protein [Rhodoalgimonas zhirmunskyi]MDQ2093378.1 uracil-DNA glycosylase family protein [Rhodoalgimonas zhirmunskyi]
MSEHEGEGEEAFIARIRACRLCAGEFAQTRTQHQPRPVPWFRSTARLLIAGQAPGMRVHESGVPFDDRSGDRLREWLGLSRAQFYDQDRVAVVPMAFCFPGYDAKGGAKAGDLPPPPRCAETWRAEVMAHLPRVATTVVIGGYAQGWHLGREARKAGVTATVRDWRAHAPEVFAIPHPSWRNNAFLRRNPWFEDEVLPALRARVAEVLDAR